MARGGRRNGKPGASYPQRSDLNTQPVRTATNQPYGQAGQQQAAQQAIPLPQQGQAGAQAAAPQPSAMPPPTPLDAPTERPGEPLTAGVPMGPGPGSEVLGGPPNPDTGLEGTLRGLYQTYRNSDLAKLIASVEMRNQ